MNEEVIVPAWDPIAYLSGLHTRQIMNLRDDCHKFQHDAVDLLEYAPYHTITLDQIREVLATREHIPNKAEAKVIRQQKAKAKRNR